MSEYVKYDHHEHVLKVPDMYVGSLKLDSRPMFVYDSSANTITRRHITFSPSLYKIYDEVLVNARDHTVRDKKCNTIKVNINRKTGSISVYNNGSGISTYYDDKNGCWSPELIFGNLLSSSNYDKKGKLTGGKNGLGAKLANIYSTEFIVETYDAKTNRKYYQRFHNNMYNKDEPVITEPEKKEKPYTRITFHPDYARFDIEGITDDIYDLFVKRVYDIAACACKTTVVYFNDSKINIDKFNDYIALYLGTEVASELTYCEIADSNNIDRWWVGAVYMQDPPFGQMSFVNGLWTIDGGTHVDHVITQIFNGLSPLIVAKHKSFVPKPSMIRERLVLFVNSAIEDPEFSGQTKETLKTKISDFTHRFDVPADFIKSLAKSGIIDDIVTLAKSREDLALKKTDGKKNARIRHDKLDDAEWAGTRKSSECYLIVTEGDSAKSFALDGLEVIGRERYGVFPLKGKPLNVREATNKQILNNEEFKNIRQIMGLQTGVVYNKDNISKLRYGGGIIILSDADTDGLHIKGLLINMFETFWPSLVKRPGFVRVMKTPLIKAFKRTDSKKKNAMIFYTSKDYDDWVTNELNGDVSKYSIKYYKGLGTSKDHESKEAFTDVEQKLMSFIWEADPNAKADNDQVADPEPADNEQASESSESSKKSAKQTTSKKSRGVVDAEDINSPSRQSILLAFKREMADDRKTWLQKYDPTVSLDYNLTEVTYSDFIHKDLKHFSNDDNIRSIPSICDGLKPSQRKIIYACQIHDPNMLRNEVKVAQLGAFVAQKTQYHHGEMSLFGAIIKMAQDYVNSNNLNLLLPNGNFGSRRQNGDDSASPRYIFTQLSPLFTYIFRPEDDDILNYLTEEGKSIEPEYYLPIIPTILMNGTIGVGTGYSTDVPMFNPIEIIDTMSGMLREDDPKELMPWYRGFNGRIEKIIDKKTRNYRYKSYGKYELLNDEANKRAIIRITELPIGISIDDYKTFVNDLVDKEELQDMVSKSGNNKVHFDLYVDKAKLQDQIKQDIVYDTYKLSSWISISNMHLYNDKFAITKYDQVSDIFYDFYTFRSAKYEQRIKHMINHLTNQLNILEYKVKFITEIVTDKFDIRRKKETVVIKHLEDSGYPRLHNDYRAPAIDRTYKYITDMNLFALTAEKIDELNELHRKKQEELDAYSKTTVTSLWGAELAELRAKYVKYLSDWSVDFTKDIPSENKSKRKTK